MKRIFFGLIFVVVLVVGAVLSLPLLLSSDRVWAEISPVLEEQAGRKISVSGSRKLSLYPNIALVLKDVEIGSSVSENALATLDELQVSVNLMSLFGGDISITALILNGANIRLTRDKSGVENWQTAQKTKNDDPLGALIEQTITEPQTNTEFDLNNLSIKNFKINNSQIIYSDLQNGTSQQLKDINLSINLTAQNKKLSINGNANWQQQKINLNLENFGFADFLNNQKTELNLKLKSTAISAQVEGVMQNGERLGFDGKIELNANSIKQLAQWFEADLSDINDSTLSLNSNLNVSGNIYQLADYNINIFDSKIAGALNIEMQDSPNITGKVNIDNLDYNRIIIADNSTSEQWSNVPIKLDILANLNSNIEFNIGSVKYKDINANALNSKLVIRNSNADIPFRMAVFNGDVLGQISVGLNKSTLNISGEIVANNIKAGDALKNLDITDKLSGTTNLDAKISTFGNSTRQFMQNLKGRGNVEMLDGVISGIAIADALAPEIANIDLSLNSPEKLVQFALQAGKNITKKMSANFSNGTGAEKQTKFVKATMSYIINKGVLDNKDLAINSESIVIRGAGIVDLGNKSLNYRVIPKVVRENAQGSAERMTIPVLIKGSWSNPSIEADYAYAIENSSTINNIRKSATEKITEKVTEKVAEEIINRVGDEVGKNITDQIGNVFGLGKQE